MAIGSKWLSSLEAGRRIVLCCFIVISTLAGVCGKLYYDKNKIQERYNTLQEHYAQNIAKIQGESNAKIERIQREAGLKYEAFMEGQLLKTEALRQEYSDMIFHTDAAKKGALKNNVKVKTLIKNEQKNN